MKKNILKNKEVIFIDFDGTIKKSDHIKGKAFVQIFGKKVKNKEKITNHHLENLGISRIEKIPIYLVWNNINNNKKNILKYSTKFSKLVIKKIYNSKWVLGAKKFIQLNQNKKLILITATPKNEIKIILKKLNIINYFYKIYGSPIDKIDVVKRTLKKLYLKKGKYMYIGNSDSDYLAAKKNNIDYYNVGKLKNIKKKYNKIKNFKSFNY
tara:strand:+ start:8 stop:637 length:630 start_codon:yes stop_codon:yes gene_type:complete